MSKKYIFLFIILTPVLLAPAFAQSSFSARVTIDTTLRYQTIFGFGASIKRNTQALYALPAQTIAKIETLCFRDLQITMLRMMAKGSIEPADDTSKLSWNYYNLNKEAHAANRGMIVSGGRINYIWATCNSAPAWQKTNASEAWGGAIRSDMYPKFVDFLVAFIRGMKQQYNITINAISPWNEPGVSVFYESMTPPPEQVRDIIPMVKNELLALEASGAMQHVDVMAPECCEISATGIVPAQPGFSDVFNLDSLSELNYLTGPGGVFTSPPSAAALDIVATHDYFEFKDYSANWDSLKTIAGDKPLWMAEVNSGATDSTTGIDNAVKIAKLQQYALTKGNVRAWCFDKLFCPIGADNALVEWDSTGAILVPKRYFGVCQFVNFVRPGFVRVSCISSNNHLIVSAYKNAASDTLVAVLVNDSAVPFALDLAVPASAGAATVHATDGAENNCSRLSDLAAPVNGSTLDTIPPLSIRTLVFHLAKTTAVQNPALANHSPALSASYDNQTIHLTWKDFEPGRELVISLFDMTGRKLMVMNSSSQTVEGNENLSAASLPSGMYLVQVAGGGTFESVKVSVVR